MRFTIAILSTAILALIGGTFAPWWIIAVAAFLVALFAGLRPSRSFIAGFAGIGIYWLLAALYHDLPNEHILSTRMAGLFHLPGSWAFMTVSVFIGALAGGLSAWAGALLKPARTH